MTHTLAVVVVEPTDDINAAVAALMEPYRGYSDERFWDSYRIGGRWTGWGTDDGGNDIRPVKSFIEQPGSPMTLVLPDGRALHYEEWKGDERGWEKMSDEDWERMYREALAEFPEHVGVVVDYHS